MLLLILLHVVFANKCLGSAQMTERRPKPSRFPHTLCVVSKGASPYLHILNHLRYLLLLLWFVLHTIYRLGKEGKGSVTLVQTTSWKIDSNFSDISVVLNTFGVFLHVILILVLIFFNPLKDQDK